MAQIKISELNSADTLNNNDLIPVINGGDTKSTTIAQLKEKMDIPDTSNLATLSTAQTISGKKTFSTLPESSVVPTTNDQLVNKYYVDTNYTSLSGAQTVTGKKTFSTLPESSVTPTGNDQLANKKYVDDSIAAAITTTLGGSY